MGRGEKNIQSHVEDSARTAMNNPDHPDLYVPDGALYREAQQAVLTALRQHPDLSLNGFRYNGYDKDPFEGAKSEHDSRARLFSDDSLAQVATAIRWIDNVKKIKTYKCGSYGAKHRAEKWGKENGLASYVANSATASARLHRGHRAIVIQKRIGAEDFHVTLDHVPTKSEIRFVTMFVKRGK